MITSMARARLGRARRHTMRTAFGWLLALGLGEGGFATAADLSIKSSVSQNTEATDNIDLSADSAGITLISRTSASTSFTAAMPTFVLGGDVDLSYVAYSGAGSGERENRFLPRFSLSVKRESKTTAFSLDGSIAVRDTTSTQFDDTGRTNVDADQTITSLNANITRQINHNNSVSLSAGATSVSFSGGAGNFVPSRSAKISGAWNHLVNSRTSANINASVDVFDNDDDRNTRRISVNTGVGLSLQRAKSTMISVNLGPRLTFTERDSLTPLQPRESTTDFGITGGLDASHRQKRTTYTFSASQGLFPSSSGELQSRTVASADVNHAINERSNAGIRVSYSIQQALGSGPFSEGGRQTLSVEPSYSIRFNRYWQGSVRYRFRSQDDNDERVVSNSVFVNVARDITWLP